MKIPKKVNLNKCVVWDAPLAGQNKSQLAYLISSQYNIINFKNHLRFTDKSRRLWNNIETKNEPAVQFEQIRRP